MSPREPACSKGLSWRWQFVVFLVVACAVVSRRPDALLNPQFYAEDGAVWYAQGYNLGWLHSLTLPDGGYLNTLPRIVAGLSSLVPFRSAPLVMNWFGIGLQVLPVTVLLSSRCAGWGPLWVRSLQAALYVAMPNSREVDVVVTNAQWHVALLALLIVLAKAPTNAGWKVFDVALLTMCGVTGPFCILLLPVAVFFWWKRRQPWSLVVISILGASALIQSAELLLGPASARHVPGQLGANPLLFCRLLAGQVFTAALMGENRFAVHAHAFKAVTISLAGVLLLIYAGWRGTLELRLFIGFSFLLFCASLRTPLIVGQTSQWEALAIDPGARYWLFPTIAFLWSLLWLATQNQQKWSRAAFAILLLLVLRGIVKDWKYPPFSDRHFGTYAQQFESAPPGTHLVIPIYPDRMVMRLVKKGRSVR